MIPKFQTQSLGRMGIKKRDEKEQVLKQEEGWELTIGFHKMQAIDDPDEHSVQGENPTGADIREKWGRGIGIYKHRQFF